jgi:hypothetical protein
MFQQGTDHPHRKAITGTDRIDDIGHRHAGDKTLIQMRAVISALRAKLDRHGLGTLIEIKRRNVRRIFKTGQQTAFAQPRQHPMGEGGEAVDLGDHFALAGPQARAQIRIE